MLTCETAPFSKFSPKQGSVRDPLNSAYGHVNPHACSYSRIRSPLTDLERPLIEGLLGRYFGDHRKLRLRVATDRSWDVAVAEQVRAEWRLRIGRTKPLPR